MGKTGFGKGVHDDERILNVRGEISKIFSRLFMINKFNSVMPRSKGSSTSTTAAKQKVNLRDVSRVEHQGKSVSLWVCAIEAIVEERKLWILGNFKLANIILRVKMKEKMEIWCQKEGSRATTLAYDSGSSEPMEKKWIETTTNNNFDKMQCYLCLCWKLLVKNFFNDARIQVSCLDCFFIDTEKRGFRFFWRGGARRRSKSQRASEWVSKEEETFFSISAVIFYSFFLRTKIGIQAFGPEVLARNRVFTRFWCRNMKKKFEARADTEARRMHRWKQGRKTTKKKLS